MNTSANRPPASRSILELLIALFLSLAWVPNVAGELRVSNLFGDGMVLQRDKPVRIWGWGAGPGESVTVRFAGQQVRGQAGGDGSWRVTLKPMDASFESRELRISTPSSKLAIKDVFVGEVWLCGGQSNMQRSVGGALDPDMEIASADRPAIRYLRLQMIASHEVADDVPLQEGKGWRPCTPEHVRDCTAVGYHFAVRLQRYLRVPVGLIDNSWGGTMSQYWCSDATLRAIPEMKPYFAQFDQAVKAWVNGGGQAGAKKRLGEQLVAWEAAAAKAKQEGKRAFSRTRARCVSPRACTTPCSRRWRA